MAIIDGIGIQNAIALEKIGVQTQESLLPKKITSILQDNLKCQGRDRHFR